MDSWCVYKHTSPSEKVYIGIAKDVKHRWRSHGEGYKGSTRIYYAIRKYGWDNFQHEILYDGLSRDDACKKEIELIAFYHSTDPAYGYNLSPGGELVSTQPETRKKLSESLKGHPVSPELIARLSEMHKIPIICLETLKVYPSAQEVAEELGVNSSSIWKVVKGKCGSCKGLHFVYLDDYKNGVYPQFSAKPKGRKVICVTTNIIYENATEASKLTGINRRAIAYACSGIHETAGGNQWAFVDEYNPSDSRFQQTTKYIVDPIICIETGKAYYTINEIAVELGVNFSSISRIIDIGSKSCKNFHFAHASKIANCEYIVKKLYKQVTCIEDKMIYDNITEASKKTNISRKQISRACNGQTKTAGGKHWKFIDT